MIKNLQALRAFAAISVIFVHLPILLGRLHMSTFGGGGVDLFFVISGFVMVYTTEFKTPAASEFMLHRIVRVVPIYWLATLSVFSIALIAPSLLGATRANFGDLLKSLLFIPYKKINGLVEPVLFVGWSLNYEMFFYVLFTLGLALRNYALGIGAVLACLTTLNALGLWFQPSSVLLAFYSNSIIVEFGLGMVIALMVARAPKRAPLWVMALTALTVLTAPVLLLENLIWPSYPGVLFSGPLSALLVTGAVLLDRWGWSVSWAPALLVGDASYVLYLTHPYVTQTFQKLKIPLSPVILIVLVLGFCLLLAVAVHKMVERPLTNRLRRLIAAPPQTVSSPA
jgi:peptidoglycan/LPS O-acetylase OafA/YrhL